MRHLLGVLITVLLAITSASAFAAKQIAAEPGISGFFTLGVGAISSESNMLATFFAGSADLGDDTIDDPAQDPDSESSAIPLVGLSVTYTFENKATELFFGSSLEDFVRFDFATALGVRHQVGDVGIFEVSALSTPIATEVWEDPYLVGSARDETDRTATGARLEWGSILGSGFDVRLSSREVEIDDERSGDALVAAATITSDEQKLLDRNGDIIVASVVYNWNIEEGRIFTISVNSIEHDLDGDAMSSEGTSVQLAYAARLNDRTRMVGNLLFGSFDYDEEDSENPIFDETDESDLTGLTLTFFLSDPFGFKGWVGNAGFVYAEEDHDIDFYDSNATMVSLGVLRRF
jgi:hypothetical protein